MTFVSSPRLVLYPSFSHLRLTFLFLSLIEGGGERNSLRGCIWLRKRRANLVSMFFCIYSIAVVFMLNFARTEVLFFFFSIPIPRKIESLSQMSKFICYEHNGYFMWFGVKGWCLFSLVLIFLANGTYLFTLPTKVYVHNSYLISL